VYFNSYAVIVTIKNQHRSVIYTNSVRTSQETRYVCATEPNQLMASIGLSVHERKHYVSATEPSRLIRSIISSVPRRKHYISATDSTC
jgi:hypothetical protein